MRRGGEDAAAGQRQVVGAGKQLGVAAGQRVFDDLGDLAVGTYAHHAVYLRYLGEDLVLIALGQTAGDQHALELPLFF